MANKIHINHVILTGTVILTGCLLLLLQHSKYTVAEPVPSVLNPIKLQYIDILLNIAEMFQDNPTCTYRMKTGKIVSQLK